MYPSPPLSSIHKRDGEGKGRGKIRVNIIRNDKNTYLNSNNVYLLA